MSYSNSAAAAGPRQGERPRGMSYRPPVESPAASRFNVGAISFTPSAAGVDPNQYAMHASGVGEHEETRWEDCVRVPAMSP